MNKPVFYTLSFQFKTAKAMVEFWVKFQDTNRSPKNDWDDCCIMHYDALMNQSSMRQYVIRKDRPGNGRKIIVDSVSLPEERQIKISG